MVYKGLFSLTLEWEYDPSDEEIVFISSMKFESGKWERFHITESKFPVMDYY